MISALTLMIVNLALEPRGTGVGVSVCLFDVLCVTVTDSR